MNIISWNVAGLRARLNKNEVKRLLFSQPSDKKFGYKYFDIVCLQETKCNEEQANLTCEITIRYPYRYWKTTSGTTQRKGLSGVSIWSSIKPIKEIEPPDFDEEGRILTLEFDEYILINVLYLGNKYNKETMKKIKKTLNNKNIIKNIHMIE